MNLQVRQIQEALARAGFDPGPVDGIWGRRTLAAVKAFQAREHLEVDGIVGPDTAAALKSGVGGGAAIPQPQPWMEEATRLIYTKELAGPRSNPAILDWAKAINIPYSGDDVPWCGLFVGHCIGATLPEEVLPGGLLLAQSWRKFGTDTTPRPGAVMVFWRVSRESGLGHVGFYTGEDDSAYRILGGNQGDSVCYIWVSKQRFLQARWPKTAVSLQGAAEPVRLDRDQDLSRNER